MTIRRYEWRRLTHLQVGRYAEYHSTMEFTLLGFDVLGADVDDKGIDFVIWRGVADIYDVQVKSIRPKWGSGNNFFTNHLRQRRRSLLAAVVLFEEDKPASMFLVPSLAWNKTDSLLVSRDNENEKSEPEWDINLSGKTRPLHEHYGFDWQVEVLWGSSEAGRLGL